MADGPSKQNITAIFKRLRSSPTNKQCFDCAANNPTWASVTYGVFLCIDCSAVHRSLGVHLTFIRSTQLDTSWTWLQLRAMQIGGNAAATAYFRQHGCTSTDAQQKYNSRAATLYREKLHGSAVKALHLHGTKLHIDSNEEVNSPTNKDVDFFKQHVEDEGTKLSDWTPSVATTQPQAVPVRNGTVTQEQQLVDNGVGPSVEAALSTSPTEAVKVAEPRKPTIGARKPGAKKGGLGAKKGFGGQKVKANFSDIEKEALQKDKDREQLAENLAIQEVKTKEEKDKKMASMRLAYQDLSVQEKKQNEKLKHMDPKKAAQAERLGMGFTGSRGVSHSVVSDMKVIEQEKPRNERDRFVRDRDFDDFEFISSSGFSSGPPKYNDSPFGVRKEDRWDSGDRYGSSGWGSSSSSDRYESKKSIIEDIPMHKPDDDRGRSRKNFEASADSDEAQKKFADAKAISSDQFFGPRDTDFETKQNLSKFDGKSSISSAELFGNGPAHQPSRGQYGGGAGPDLQEIRDGVRQGVTKVAGKISSLTTGIISSIQRKQ